MRTSIDGDWSYAGQPLIRLDNGRVSVAVIPALGGRIFELVDHGSRREWLWHNPRVKPHHAPLGAPIDDHFSGGWDDVFPTCDPCVSPHGDQLPSFGEVWTSRLDARCESLRDGGAAITMTGCTPITPARWTRRVHLAADSTTVSVTSTVENVGHRSFSYAAGSHIALGTRAGDRVEVPARRGIVRDAGGDPRTSLGAIGDEYCYPFLPGSGRDVRRVLRPEAGSYALHALTDLSADTCQVTGAAGESLTIRFDRDVHPCIWQWMSYGGHRGWNHLILEPWTTSYPRLDDAIAAGEGRTLAPGESSTMRVEVELRSQPTLASSHSGNPEERSPWPPS